MAPQGVLASSVPVMAGYGLVNGNITWSHGPITVALWGTNLLDQKYLNAYLDKSLLSKAIPTLPFLWNDLAIYGDRRRVGVRVKYAF